MEYDGKQSSSTRRDSLKSPFMEEYGSRCDRDGCILHTDQANDKFTDTLNNKRDKIDGKEGVCRRQKGGKSLMIPY